MCAANPQGSGLADDLLSGEYECVVCSEPIGRRDRLWSCTSCYGVLHLNCIASWSVTQAKEREAQLRSTSTTEDVRLTDKFRCPLCQGLNDVSSTKTYRCYCGKVQDPPVDPMLVPGSCGETCERRHRDVCCPHPCTLMCHPGACPPCTRMREQACYCGKHVKMVGCSSDIHGYECDDVCDKLLDCGNHRCSAPCHEGACPVCRVTLKESCYCGAATRTRRCADPSGFRCQNRCTHTKDCSVHACGLLCHDGPHDLCSRLPSRTRFCPCGKTRINADLRQTCTDPIPTCGLPCELPLPCGHLCSLPCHDSSPCAPCTETISEPCGCGAKVCTLPCFCTYLPESEWAHAAERVDLPKDKLPASYPPRCHKVCRQPLSCHKHKCPHTCCTDTEHLCLQICTKKLPCGLHRCGQLCHTGACAPCAHVSYERLYCRCRRTWIDPPVPCGTRVPKCNHPCIIPRACGHPSNHPCHSEEEKCPECVMLVEKRCASHNEVFAYHRPCFQKDISCGKKCEKPLTCCGTVCQLTCHGGPCVHKCNQKYPTLADTLRKGATKKK